MKHLINSAGDKIGAIVKHAQNLQHLNGMIKQYLPESIKEHVWIGSFQQGNLVLSTDNAVWATELRYLLPELRDKLRKEANLYQLRTIKVNLSAPLETIKQKKKSSIQLSPTVQEIIQSQSQHCSFEPLKKALQKLSQS